MTEDSIFSAAAAITDPAKRSVFLREQCAGNPTLLQRLQARLLSQTQLDDEATMPPDPTPPGRLTQIICDGLRIGLQTP